MLTVVARHHDRVLSTWLIESDSIEEAIGEVTVAVQQETGKLPICVLVVFPGGKK